MMDRWFPSPLTAFEMEARRAAAEEGRFPPSDPATVPIQYSPNVDYHFPRVLSRSCSHSSSSTPPPYTEDRHTIIPSPVRVDSEVLNHTNCSNQYLPMPVYNEDYLDYQSTWKGEHVGKPSDHSGNYSVVYPNPNSNHEDIQLRKRPSNVLQAKPIVNNGFHQGCSPSSSPLSAYDSISVVNPRPNDYPVNCTFISQVFKPLYKKNEHKELGSHSYLTVRDGKCSEFIPLNSLLQPDSSKESCESYHRMVIPGGRKTKRPNEKRFPCPDCGRMFARAFNMETHRKTHLGFRPHHCPQCQKSFSRRHDLQRHLSAVHNQQSKSHSSNYTQPSSPQGSFNPELGTLETPDGNEKNIS